MLDVVTPSFHQVRNQGAIICNPMYKEEIYHDIDFTEIDMVGTYKATPIHGMDAKPNGLEVVPLTSMISSTGNLMPAAFELYSRETSLAITRAHADVNVSEMNVYASLGELPETIAWLRNRIRAIQALTMSFRKKAEVAKVMRQLQTAAKSDPSKFNLRRFESYVTTLKKRKASAPSKDSRDAILNLWLEWRYAVRPLIADIQNIIKVLDTKLTSKRLTARGREYVIGETSSSFTVPNTASDSLEVRGTEMIRNVVKARAGCLYVVDSHLTSILDVLGIDQPLEALWELTSFSFVLDWVFSIGDYLESLFKSSGLSILTSWVTLSVELHRTRKITYAQIHPATYYAWPYQQFVLGSSHMTAKWKWRMPNPALPLLPRFDLKVDLAKLIDLGAIARNAIAGKKIPVTVRRD